MPTLFNKFQDSRYYKPVMFWLGLLLLLLGVFGVLYMNSTRLLEYQGDIRKMVYVVSVTVMILVGAYFIMQSFRERQEKLKKVRLNRHRVQMTTQGSFLLLLLLIFFVASSITKSNALMVLFSLMAGAFVVNGGMGMMMVRGARIKRRLPPSLMAGERVSINVDFKNRNRLRSAWAMTVKDHIHHQTESLTAQVLFAHVLPRKTATGHYEFRPMRRGVYTFGPIEVTSRAPFGLIERGHIYDSSKELIVFPFIGRLTTNWKNERAMAADLVQQRQTRKGVFDDEYHSLREYRTGDNPRAIHWRTSARRNELMIREFHQSRDADLMVMLDLWLPENPSEEESEAVEKGVSFAAAVSLEQMQASRDSNLSILINGDKLTTWWGRSSPVGIEEMLELYAKTEPGTDQDPINWIEAAHQHRSTSTSIILITSRPAEEIARMQMLIESAFDDPLQTSFQISSVSEELNQYYVLN